MDVRATAPRQASQTTRETARHRRRALLSCRVRALVPHSVAARRHHQDSPPFSTLWFRYSGVLFTLAMAISIELTFGTPLQISQPTLLLLVAVVYTIVTGKLLAGMTSAGIAVAYELFFFVAHGNALRYSVFGMVLVCLILPLTAAMVGVLRKHERDAWAERERLLREHARAQTHTLALEQANQRMDEFLSVASHELRSPLGALRLNIQKGASQLRHAAMPADALPTDMVPADVVPARCSESAGVSVVELLGRADRQVDRVDRIVRDLLDVSRLRSGNLPILLAPCDLAALVREVVETYAQMAPEREITLEIVDALAEAPVMILADGDRIRQVLENFLNNALRYDQSGQPIAVTLSANATEARVAVRDQGPGIPLAQQRAVWERFQRVGHFTSGSVGEATGGGGLGLGLYICRELIEHHEGRIGVESCPGAGSSFWFSLARQPLLTAVPAVETATVHTAHPEVTKARPAVLV